MSSRLCPNCGKPLRPGARFCGHCGSPVPVSPPASAGAPPATSENVCPHCGKPLRAGAKFCNHCGKPVAAAPAPPGEAIAPPPPAARGPISKPVAPMAPARAKTGRKKWWLIGVVLLLVFCVVVVGGGAYVYLQDPFGWIRTMTPTLEITETQPAPTVETLTPTASATSGILPVSETPASSETLPATETQIIPPTQTSEPQIIFREDFEAPLTENWHLWGSPLPLLRTGFSDRYMELLSESPGTSGVASKLLIQLIPGTVIEFEARLVEDTPKSLIVFQWNPGLDKAQPRDRPGVLQLTIERTRLVLETAMTQGRCELPMDGLVVHTFQLEFFEGGAVEVIVDFAPAQSCRVENIGIVPVDGRISFSGRGWVSSVKVYRR